MLPRLCHGTLAAVDGEARPAAALVVVAAARPKAAGRGVRRDSRDRRTPGEPVSESRQHCGRIKLPRKECCGISE